MIWLPWRAAPDIPMDLQGVSMGTDRLWLQGWVTVGPLSSAVLGLVCVQLPEWLSVLEQSENSPKMSKGWVSLPWGAAAPQGCSGQGWCSLHGCALTASQ